MFNEDIWEAAMKQSAIDLNCSVDDFKNKGNTVVISKLNEGRKNVIKMDYFAALHIPINHSLIKYLCIGTRQET